MYWSLGYSSLIFFRYFYFNVGEMLVLQVVLPVPISRKFLQHVINYRFLYLILHIPILHIMNIIMEYFVLLPSFWCQETLFLIHLVRFVTNSCQILNRKNSHNLIFLMLKYMWVSDNFNCFVCCTYANILPEKTDLFVLIQLISPEWTNASANSQNCAKHYCQFPAMQNISLFFYI